MVLARQITVLRGRHSPVRMPPVGHGRLHGHIVNLVVIPPTTDPVAMFVARLNKRSVSRCVVTGAE